jgi:hypothetical protein
MLLSDPLQHLPPQCNLNLSRQYFACYHIPTRLTCAFPQCYLITTAHQVAFSVDVLAFALGSPTLLASCPPRYQNLAGACPNFTRQHQQTIHNTNTTIIHHYGLSTIHPPSSDLPPYHHALHHACLPMPPRPLRVHSSRSAQAALKSRSTSTTSKTSSMGTSSFAPTAPQRPPPPPT